MAQYLKEDVQARILDSALDVFARGGYAATTVAGIARRAGVSTGNVYHYFAGKKQLFEAAVPPDIPETLLGLVRRRVSSLERVEDVRDLGPEAPFLAASEALLAFALQNRLRLVILLRGASGTRYGSFARELQHELESLAVAHFRARRPGLAVSRTLQFVLDRIYANLVAVLAEILASSHDEAEIRAAVDSYSRYHLAGLKGLFEWEPAA